MRSSTVAVLLLAMLGASWATVPKAPKFEITPELKEQLMKQINSKFIPVQKIRPVTINNVGSTSPNVFVDQVLQMIDETIKAKGDDPYTLESISFLGMTIVTTISGFSTMHRSGDAQVTKGGNFLDITCTVQIYDIEGDFQFSLDFFGIKIDAGADGLVDTVDADLAIHGEVAADGSVSLEVTDLHIHDIGRVSVEVNGLGILDPLANLFCDIFANLIKYIIPLFFDNIVKAIVNDIISNFLTATY